MNGQQMPPSSKPLPWYIGTCSSHGSTCEYAAEHGGATNPARLPIMFMEPERSGILAADVHAGGPRAGITRSLQKLAKPIASMTQVVSSRNWIETST